MAAGKTPGQPWRHEAAQDYAIIRDAADLADADGMIRAMWAYTRTCLGPDGLPTRTKFDPVAIPGLLANIWILDREGPAGALRYRLVGTKIVEAIGQDPTGRGLRESVGARAESDPALFARYDFMLATGLATWRQGPAHHYARLDYRAVENLCVPFARADGSIEQIVALSVYHRG